MKVSEFIEFLKTCPQNAEIQFNTEYGREEVDLNTIGFLDEDVNYLQKEKCELVVLNYFFKND